MATKIKSLTIVNSQGTNCYYVGNQYEGLILDRIEDRSIEFQDSIDFVYLGLTENGDTVFEAINVPMDILYEPIN